MTKDKRVRHTPGSWEVVKHSHVDGELWLSINQQADDDGMRQWIAVAGKAAGGCVILERT